MHMLRKSGGTTYDHADARMEHTLAMIEIELFCDQVMVSHDCTRGPFTFGRTYMVCTLAPVTCQTPVVYTVESYMRTAQRAETLNRFKHLWNPTT